MLLDAELDAVLKVSALVGSRRRSGQIVPANGSVERLRMVVQAMVELVACVGDGLLDAAVIARDRPVLSQRLFPRSARLGRRP